VINSQKSTIEKIKGILVDLLQIHETKTELDSKQLKDYRKAIEENGLSKALKIYMMHSQFEHGFM